MWVAFIISALALTAFSACGTVSPPEHLPERLPQASDEAALHTK